MTEKEIDMLKDRLHNQQVIIKEEHRKSKALRNTKRLEVAFKKSQTLKKWINE